MNRTEHRFVQLLNVAAHLKAASNELLSHNECIQLRKELEDLEIKVQQHIDKLNSSKHE